VAARRVLFPLYAFNVEVARAPWVASEPMIGEMRLQWWRDALDEIATGAPVRKHEVTVPLAGILDGEGAQLLDAGIAARRWDLYRDAFEDEEHFLEYLEKTGGGLMWVAARALGAPAAARDAVMRYGVATAFVRFLVAVPELEARGCVPLVDGRAEAIRALAERLWSARPTRAGLRAVLPRDARVALLEGWQTPQLLRQVMREPGRVAEGRLGLSEFRRRLDLLLASF
jgi:hypothetical protein